MSDTNKIIGSGISSQEHAQAIDEYWTEERRANAIPVPMPKDPAHAPHIAPELGEPGQTEPGHSGDEHAAHILHPHSAGGNAVANTLVYPYRVCGKIFFTQGGANYAGSASMVSPNILLTAGHCVYNGGWSTNFVFYPSYGKRAATDPAYKFSYNYLAAWTAWTSGSSNRQFDYGMAWMPASPGNIVGWLGLLWNAATAGRTWHAVGYPATPAPPFNGNTMDEAIGTATGGSGAGTLGLTNDNMEHGSSGGPWITNFNSAVLQYANGLQSFHTVDGSFTEYGPVFDANVKGLFDWINNPANRK
jgi:V8-like Glu-specific endopeptidase